MAKGEKNKSIAPDVSIARITQAVKAVAPFVPQNTCLTQAMVLDILCAMHGYSVQLRIGVAKNKEDALEAMPG